MFFKKVVEETNDKPKLELILKTEEGKISVSYGRTTFIDSYRFLSESLDKLNRKL